MALPGRNARKNRIAKFEREYDKPIREIIEELRNLGNSWMMVAVMLDIREETLIVWRRALGMEINQAKRKRMVR